MSTTRDRMQVCPGWPPRWDALLDAVRRPPTPDIHRPASVTGSASFTGTPNYATALRLAECGWPDGWHKVEAIKAHLDATLGEREDMVPAYAEAGDEPDVGRYVEGDPECMIEYAMRPVSKPVVRIVVSAAFSSGISTGAILTRGAVIVAVIDHLEARGVRCEVDISVDLRGGFGTVHQTVVRLKDATDPLDRDRLVFAICHPSFFRRIMFRLHETHGLAEWTRRGGSSYGIPTNAPTDSLGEGAIYFGMMMYGDDDYSTPEKAAAKAKSIIEGVSPSDPR